MREKGFTLIELLVVIAVVGVMVGLLLPAIQAAREARNASSAVHTLSQIRAAQAAFLGDDADGDGVRDYAGSVQELVDAGLLDDDLRGGARDGYGFAVSASDGSAAAAGYAYVATPINQGQAGVRGFGGDASGIFAFDCAPLLQWTTHAGAVACAPDPRATRPPRRPLGELSGVAAIHELDGFAGGVAVAAARALLTPEFIDEVIVAFDAGGDGRIELADLLSADLLGMARHLAARRAIPGGATALGDDGGLTAVLARLQARLNQEVGRVPVETDPALPVPALVGSPHALLDLASAHEAHAALTVLLDVVEGLAPEPALGQMASRDPDVNLRRKRELADAVEGAFSLWREQRLPELHQALGAMRQRADGVRVPRDWVKGRAASQVVARVDATLAAIETGAAR
jgi:prepilin-type N-terminal cleavage/methylation domain-containing protein